VQELWRQLRDDEAAPARPTRRRRLWLGLPALAVCCVFLGSSPSSAVATAGCPVTTHGSSAKPPTAFVRTGLPVPWVHTWLGSKAIWLRLPRHGVLPAQRDPGGRTISTKFPWWRKLAGQLHAWAHPLGRARPRLEADVAPAADYGPRGFVPSFLHFSKAGCWKITGSLRGHRLSFVTRIVRHP
jgi:hypothetical protein